MDLAAGKLRAHVGPEAVGFAVTTPSARVVDLGTEFGVVVAPSGQTEAHVIRGQVQLEPTAPNQPPVRLTANNAMTVTPGGGATAVALRPADFDYPARVIELADLVAGGDGTQSRRGAGIDVSKGVVVVTDPKREVPIADGEFRPVPDRPFIAGAFVPIVGKASVLDPDGHTFDKFGCNTTTTWFCAWAGGAIPLAPDPTSQWRPPAPTLLDGVDYSKPPHSLLFMHANKGLTFDLAALRRAHPDARLARLRAACQNTARDTNIVYFSQKSALWVFVDGKLLYSRSPIRRKDPAFELNVDLGEGGRYLTLVITDGGDGYAGDWIVLGDPRLE
jgi:hypothetical protein